MARIRSVKPEFWKSEQVVGCSRETRLLFIALWNFCDDHGRAKANFKQLKWDIFPGDDDIDADAVKRMLGELAAAGLIAFYVVDGAQYFHVTGWARHQKPQKPQPSRIPAPPDEARAATGALLAPEKSDRGAVVDHSANDTVTLPERYGTESESEKEKDPVSSSVVVPFPTREPARPDDDDEILVSRIKRALGAKGEERTIRAGLPVVRSWLAEGCALEADVLPELADVAAHASRPLATFRAEFLGRQVRARRDGRLAAKKARAAAPERVFVAEGTPEWAARVAAGHKAGLTTSAEVAGKRVRGWWFSASEAPAPEPGERAPGGP